MPPLSRTSPALQTRCLSPVATTRAPVNVPQARSEAASLEKLPPGKQRQTALLIWLHGLGMSGMEFGDELEKGIAQRMPWLQLHYPNAPWRKSPDWMNQAANPRDGEQLRAWFDLEDLPVSMGMEYSGLLESTTQVHELMRQAEQKGIPASRIVLGGFSQGGVLALQAGLTYDRAIAGIAAFSSWLPGNLHMVAKHKATPIFMGNGGKDTSVPFEVGHASFKALKESGFTHASFSRYPELIHGFYPEEFGELEAFLMRSTPQVPKPSSVSVPPVAVKLERKPSKDSTERRPSKDSTGPSSVSVPPVAVKLERKPSKDSTERRPSKDSTEVGSAIDSPPTTDDERPARLSRIAKLNMQGTSPISATRALSPPASRAASHVIKPGSSRYPMPGSKRGVGNNFAAISSPRSPSQLRLGPQRNQMLPFKPSMPMLGARRASCPNMAFPMPLSPKLQSRA